MVQDSSDFAIVEIKKERATGFGPANISLEG
jgi:hypothetical protein